MTAQHVTSKVVEVARTSSNAPIVLVCEHASNFIPPELNGLGLTEEARLSHAAWDPGALGMAKAMADKLKASLVFSKVSRLVYDCNRPPHALDAMRDVSEAFDVPGNRHLNDAQRQARIAQFYEPFESALANEVMRHKEPVIITVHSFTPVYDGRVRDLEIGILHDSDTRLADAILAVANTHMVRRNQPYGPEDGVTHTLRVHALPKSRLNVMIEVRNDLIASQSAQHAMAQTLSEWVAKALDSLGVPACKA